MSLLRSWVSASAVILVWSAVSFGAEAQTCGDFTDGLSGEVTLPQPTCYKMRQVWNNNPDAAEFGKACVEIVENKAGKKCVSAQFTITQNSFMFQNVKMGVKADCGGFGEFGGKDNSFYDIGTNVRQALRARRRSMTLNYCLEEVDAVTDCCNQALCMSLSATVVRRRRGRYGRVQRSKLVSDNQTGQSDCEMDRHGLQPFAPRCQAMLGCGDGASGPFRGFEAAFSAERGKVMVEWLPAVGATQYEIFLLDGEVDIDPETMDVADIRNAATMKQMVNGFVTTTTFTGLRAGTVVTLFMVAHFSGERVEAAEASEVVVVASVDPVVTEAGREMLSLFDRTVEWDGTGQMTVMDTRSVNIAAGDILQGITNDEKLPLGFLVFVERVVSSGLSTVLVVREASLTELFEELDLSMGYRVRNAKEGEFGEDTTASSGDLAARQLIVDPDLDRKFSISSSVTYTDGPLSLEAQTSASIRVAVKVRIEFFSFKEFDVSATGAIKVSAKATLQLGSALEAPIITKELFRFKPKVFYVAVLGVPIPITVTPVAESFFRISAEPFTARVEFGRELKWAARVRYTPETGVVPSATASNEPVDNNFIPQLVATAEMELGLQMPTDVRVLGLAGLELQPRYSVITEIEVDLVATARYNGVGGLGNLMLKECKVAHALVLDISPSLFGEEEGVVPALDDPDLTLTVVEFRDTIFETPSIAKLRIDSVECDDGSGPEDTSIVVRVTVDAFDEGLEWNHVNPQGWAHLGQDVAVEELVTDGESLEVKYIGLSSFSGPSDLAGRVVSTKAIDLFPDEVRIFKEESISSLPYGGGEVECLPTPTPTPTPVGGPTGDPTPTPVGDPTGDPMPTPTPPMTSPEPEGPENCSVGDGRDGTCISTAECAGLAKESVVGLCPGPVDIQCCVEPSAPATCSVGDGRDGTCISTAECAGLSKESVAGLCPGPVDIQCCVEPSAPATCSVGDGRDGTCISTAECAGLSKESVAGLCPGPVDIQCCVEPSAPVNCTVTDGRAGTCITTTECAGMSKESYPGFCPGAADIQCCV